MMKPVYTRIAHYERITELLGGWPSFDDFEIVSMLLERGGVDESVGPCMTVEFCGFRSDVAPQSPDRNNCLLTLRFTGFEALKLEGFNHQNAINGLVISSYWSERLRREVFNVEIVQGFGVGCVFDCDSIEVSNIERIC